MLRVTSLIGFAVGASAQYPASPTTLDYTGSDQTYNVPAGVTRIRVKAWGAGAAGANGSTYPGGGAGEYAFADLAVTPGEALTVIVGGKGLLCTGATGANAYGGGGAGSVNSSNGGNAAATGGGGGGKGTSGYCGDGGGASGVKRSSNWLCRAGGAGGGSYQSGANKKGYGGGTYPDADGQGAQSDTLLANGGSGVGDTLTAGEDGQASALALPGNSGDSDNGGKGYGGTSGTEATHGRVVIY